MFQVNKTLIFIYSITSQMFHKYECVTLHQLTNKLHNNFSLFIPVIFSRSRKCDFQKCSRHANITPTECLHMSLLVLNLVCRQDIVKRERRNTRANNFSDIKDLCPKSNNTMLWKCKCACPTCTTQTQWATAVPTGERDAPKSGTEPSFTIYRSTRSGHLPSPGWMRTS